MSLQQPYPILYPILYILKMMQSTIVYDYVRFVHYVVFHSQIYNQVMVNWWFGARWFGFPGSACERDCYLGGIPIRIPNHQFPICGLMGPCFPAVGTGRTGMFWKIIVFSSMFGAVKMIWNVADVVGIDNFWWFSSAWVLHDIWFWLWDWLIWECLSESWGPTWNPHFLDSWFWSIWQEVLPIRTRQLSSSFSKGKPHERSSLIKQVGNRNLLLFVMC